MNTKFLQLACAAVTMIGLDGYAQQKKQDPCLCFDRGEPIDSCKPCPSAFNIPAAYLTPNCFWLNDWYTDLSYTYWYVGESGLNVAESWTTAGSTGVLAANTVNYGQTFEYGSGFKIGLGKRSDDWVVAFEYAWVRNKISSSAGAGNWRMNPWFQQLQGISTGLPIVATNVSSAWDVELDLLDGGFSRPYYLARNLTVSPYAGLRAAWIRQSLDVYGTLAAGNYTSQVGGPLHSNTHSHNWGIGPRLGTEARCLFPMGFRAQGDIAASLLYTDFTTLTHFETNGNAATSAAIPTYTASMNSVSFVLPSMECGLGLGWGKYICNQKYHIDFSADYDFMVFWDQNKMRSMVDELATQAATSNDLYLHGLTVSGRFDF